ncbi:indole-3-glycerol phosphate synthase [Brevirhabdus pacifica]|uniref:Indole-3-glycerol phosphate synthase n=1 Tax=Brevirhabdus pacifica TaxID=1267768 RepID=A0A1U7DFK7_9RHOB|nr:indole-3-glycerol phosphate synthase TrpC [Brevirhabdus pacifica]APX88790.1 indole-3-glycerol phosphate synthase [Brevirhabdus pacifica]OWU80042.1 indole-3-glycerol phosphate synthase [Loktanella sp. 22II-4b]PJJ86681.1 indole-3-glycerol phosphate synthase [Brevirhabdus pacifica]
MSDNILSQIKSYKLREVAEAKAECDLSGMEQRAREADTVRPFTEALQAASRTGYGLIAEIKKASPSKGLIRADFDPALLAKAYEEGGATCLSVLTDGPSFQGAPEYLVEARAAVSLPVLRKDFLFDPYQVVESRAMGADCILIIMAAVTDAEAAALEETATTWGMDVLIEVHDAEELERAALLKSPLIGINNRDLRSFVTDLDVTRRLAKLVPEDRLIVSESGMSTSDDLADMAMNGARIFLIGEALMRKADVAAATREILRPATSAMGGM